MSRLPVLLGVALAAAATTLPAQQIRTFTESAAGPDAIVYGLPVPEPIDSLTPVDGFRRYAALEAQLQGLALSSADLAAHDIGRSSANRVHWAYVASDDDGVDVEGRPEAAFFINATTHAREWGAPEVGAGTLEYLVEHANDGGVVRYLLDNTRVIVAPVQNVDGFLQTQRYPSQAILGADPDYPQDWPRDGRMRRKNMPGVDEILATFADHLGGIDLNRNHPPFWATSVGAGGSSNDPRSLTYHGTAPHGEVENVALERAAALGPVTRMRLGIDVHTYSQVFYSSNTGRTRLNAIQNNLISRLRSHHLAVAGKDYRNVPDPSNRGIGAAAEYFAYEWLVPAWTLELEPRSNAAEYGGTTTSHGGFILPASEARRVREGWAQTHMLAFYRMAGPAHLARVRFVEVDTGRVARQLRWIWSSSLGWRVQERTGDAALVKGRRYRAELAFSKPMRLRGADGNVMAAEGSDDVALGVGVELLDNAGGALATLDTTAGAWLDDPARVLRYRDDTFAFEFDAPQVDGEFRFSVTARDFSGAAIDAVPRTPADWREGGWADYENAAGVAGDIGGADRETVGFTTVTGSTRPAPVTVVSAPTVVGEGDVARIVLRRIDNTPATMVVAYRRIGITQGERVVWEPGESDDKVLAVRLPDDADVGSDRVVLLDLVAHATPAMPTMPTLVDEIPVPLEPITVFDNDSDDLVVLRSHAQGLNMFDALWLATDVPGNGDDGRSGAAAVVVDREREGRDLPGRDDSVARPSSWTVAGPLTLYGNQAALVPQAMAASGLPIFSVAADGNLRLDALDLRVGSGRVARQLIDNGGRTTIARSLIGDGASAQPPVENRGVLGIERSAIVGMHNGGTFVRSDGGRVDLQASTLASRGEGTAGGASIAVDDADVAYLGVSVIANQYVQSTPRSVRLGHVLEQDNVSDAVPPGTPPSPSVCPPEIESLGYNISDVALCDRQPTDRENTSITLAAFEPRVSGYLPTGVAIDGGADLESAPATGCGYVDQRGAPRPQTLVANAQPRCDVGAIELGINPYRGIWAPARSGHGVDLQTRGNVLMLAWYTYGDDGQPTAYQAAAPLTGPRWVTRLQWSRRDPATGVSTVVEVGDVAIDFASDTRATLRWRFDARGVEGSEVIEASLFDEGTPRFEVTGLWYPPAEANYGATITRRGATTALGLYYYDAAGTIRWALGTADDSDAAAFVMTSFTGFCPDCDAGQMPVSGVAAGTVVAHFRTPERARLDVALTYPGAAGGVWNREAVRFEPLNDAVDNRAVVEAASGD